MRKAGIVAVLVVLLAGINGMIWRTEQVLANGDQVILQLAPVDPRSLMQGDYMALRFAVGDDIQRALLDSEQELATGQVVLEPDKAGVFRFVALDEGQALTAQQLRVQYRWRKGRVQIATNAFFFQEGMAAAYEGAGFGLFRVGENGQPYLTHLLDFELQPIGQTRELAQ